MLLATLLSVPALAKGTYDHQVSLTFSPVHLLLAMGEVTGEFRAHEKVGVAGTIGLGKPSGFLAVEGGASGRWYPLGDFDHGMQVGAEVQYLALMGEVSGIEASGSGLTMGPFLGYKIAAKFGLTFEIQTGAQYSFVSAQASGHGQTETASESDIGVLLNLQLGWSF